MNPYDVKNIRLQTKVSQSEIDALGGRKNTSKLMAAIVRMEYKNKLELIAVYQHQKNNK